LFIFKKVILEKLKVSFKEVSMTKIPVRLPAALILMLIVPPLAPGQNDVAGIFADLSDFRPAAAPPAVSSPKPQSAPAPVSSPAPASLPSPGSPALCATDNGGGASVFEKPEAPAEPIDVEACISRGKAAYADDDWNGAQGFFEAALHGDPCNADAIKWLRRIADRKAGRETKSYETTRTRMLGNVQAAWNTPKAEGEKPEVFAGQHLMTEAETQAAALRSRLERIRIPAIAFQDAGIQQVVLELSALCRKLDPECKSANLAVFGVSEAILPSITFSGTDLSVLETLDIITQMSGMKYEIGPNRVSLTPVNYEPLQEMVSVEFDIMPSVGAKMAARAGGQAGGLLDTRDFFSTVSFPAGASAQYNPEFNVLLVRNVPKYIEKTAVLLDRYNRKALDERSRQVEIETKFIEVSQGSLEELGFDWTLGTPGEYITSDTWTMPGGQQLFTDTLRTGQDAFSTDVNPADRAAAFNTYAGAVSDQTGTGLIGTAGEMLVQKVKGDLKVDLLIRALERTAGADLLSAPKILTKSGETARIHVGEVHWFPTAFDVTLERYAQPTLVPLDYEEERTGVMLEVTPELDPETGTINMKLSPEIRELAGFDEQHVGTIWPEFGEESLDINSDTPTNDSLIDFLTLREENRTVSADRLIARRPVFKSRKVDTTVTIEDGSTIAMGGLIKEQLETFKDSVPVLGKIPLLGRLFRSEGERSVKRNLLIFVSASQVDASGYKKNGL
jgi:general secretion pathway protein D